MHTRTHLIEETIRRGLGTFSAGGALMVDTGKFTGRAADDKYVVACPYSEKVINWKNKTGKLTRQHADALRAHLLGVLERSEARYQITRTVGAHQRWRIKATLVTQGPSHALFFDNMMRPLEAGAHLQEWTIFHTPFYTIEKPSDFGLTRGTAIVLDFEKREVLIAGTAYAGEVKKAMFSVMNTLLPEHGVLPMHAGANISATGMVSVFFGLSGTGKTTLSTDEGLALLGDDEHGFADDGVFNFEGGCYAKTAKLSQKDEPQIFAASTRFGAILENVALKSDGAPDFLDLSKTENGRSSYPLAFIDGVHPGQAGPVAHDIFFLSADATGVLPPVASLTATQAQDYFLTGYTSKLAGTEVGIKEPKAAFSYCFGAPFMMRPAQEYAQLLSKLVEKHQCRVWLINTGWSKGGYGVSERFPLKVTRQIIRSIQKGEVAPLKGEVDPVFGFVVPQEIPGVDKKLLQVSLANDPKAIALKQQFQSELEKVRG
ncbi:MAG: phosphoenolpyruvate carboxykinase (ATP) [Bacteriovoracia bacterium]